MYTSSGHPCTVPHPIRRARQRRTHARASCNLGPRCHQHLAPSAPPVSEPEFEVRMRPLAFLEAGAVNREQHLAKFGDADLGQSLVLRALVVRAGCMHAHRIDTALRLAQPRQQLLSPDLHMRLNNMFIHHVLPPLPIAYSFEHLEDTTAVFWVPCCAVLRSTAPRCNAINNMITIYIYIYISLSLYIYIYINMYVCMYVCMNV